MDFDAHNYTLRQGENRTGDVIELDGHWFDGCTFTDCTLVFRGIKPFGYVKTEFPGCALQFEDHALLTLDRIITVLGDGIVTEGNLGRTLLALAAGKITFN